MKVAVRVDASRAIGTGHVRRMGALGEALARAGADVRMLSRDLGTDINGVQPPGVTMLPRLPASTGDSVAEKTDPAHAAWLEVPQRLDAEQTIDALSDFSPDWIVVDHYGLDASWHARVQAATRARLAVIDDLGDRPLAADVIIDHNFHPDHAVKYARANLNACPVLGGPLYALIGHAYAGAPRYRFNEAIRSIGIFMGGVDAIDATGMALDSISAAGLGAAVEIVTTTANPHLASLRERLSGNPAVTISMNLPDLAGFYARHDLQIGAGGGALWERFCIGAPTLAVICADNQLESVPLLANLGVVRMANAVNGRPQALTEIATALRDLATAPAERRQLAERDATLVDGKGTGRIATWLCRDREGAAP